METAVDRPSFRRPYLVFQVALLSPTMHCASITQRHAFDDLKEWMLSTWNSKAAFNMSERRIRWMLCFYIIINASDAGTDYSQCAGKIRRLGLTCPDSPEAFCPSGLFPNSFNSSHPALTIPGCYKQCGKSFEFVPTKEILGMIAVWLIPYITLSKSFCFPALGKLNSAKIVVFLISNPIGSMWSMLTRQEAFRRIVQDASEEDLGEDWPDAMEIATVAAAVEELSWENRTAAIVKELKRFMTAIERAKKKRIDGEPRLAEAKPAEVESAEIEQAEAGPAKVGPAEIEPNGSSQTLLTATPTPSDVSKPYEFTASSIKSLFTQARYELISHRNDSQTGTWIAVITLIASIVIAFVKNVTAEQRKYLPRTVAIVSLGFYFVTLVQISGNIGAFGKGYVSLKAIRRLQEEIKRLSSGIPELSTSAGRLSDAVMEVDAGRRSIDDYLELNPIWRPNKSIDLGEEIFKMTPSPKGTSGKPLLKKSRKSNKRDRPPMLLLFYAFCTVSISYGGALYVSYNAARRPGFGCQCLLGTCIYVVWLLNAATDCWIHCCSKRESHRDTAHLKKDWNFHVILNSFMAASIIISLLAYLSGFLNVCACNAGSLIPGPLNYVNLFPPTDTQWRRDWEQGGGTTAVGLLLNCLIILFLSCDWTLKPKIRRPGVFKNRIKLALDVILVPLGPSALWTLNKMEEKDMSRRLFDG